MPLARAAFPTITQPRFGIRTSSLETFGCRLRCCCRAAQFAPYLICTCGAAINRDLSALSISTINDCAHGNTSRRACIIMIRAVDSQCVAFKKYTRLLLSKVLPQMCYYSYSKQSESSRTVGRFGGVGNWSRGQAKSPTRHLRMRRTTNT